MKRKTTCLFLTVLTVFSMIGMFALFAPRVSAASEKPSDGTIVSLNICLFLPHDGMSVTAGNVKSRVKISSGTMIFSDGDDDPRIIYNDDGSISRFIIDNNVWGISDELTLSSATLTSSTTGMKFSGVLSPTSLYNLEIKFKIKDGYTISDKCVYSLSVCGYEGHGNKIKMTSASNEKYSFSTSVSGQTLTLKLKRVSLYFKEELDDHDYCDTSVYRIGYGVEVQYDVPFGGDTEFKSVELLEWRDHTTEKTVTAFTNEKSGTYDAVVRLTLNEWLFFPKDKELSYYTGMFGIWMHTAEYDFAAGQFKSKRYFPYKVLELTDSTITLAVELPYVGKDECYEIICKNCTAYFNGVPVHYLAERGATVTIVCDPPADGKTVCGYLENGSRVKKMGQTFSYKVTGDVTIEIEYKKLIREVRIENFIPAYIGEHPIYGNVYATADEYHTPTDEELRYAASQTVELIIESMKASDPSKVPTEEEIQKFYEAYYEEVKNSWRKWEYTTDVLGMHAEVGEDKTFSDSDYRFTILLNYDSAECVVGEETKIYINGNLWTGEYTYSNSKLILLMHAQEKKTFKVSFSANGGGGTMKAESIPALFPFELPLCTFTAPSGKIFDSWKIGTKTYKVGDTVYPDGNMTVTAVWTQSHTHNGELVPDVMPTCTKEGVIAYYKCSCGKIFTDSACTDEITDRNTMGLPMASHTVSDWIIDKDAEPGVEGSRHKECMVCHTVIETETIPALAEGCKHTNAELVNAVEATCTAKGYTGDTVCKDCGATVEKGVETDALGHDYGEDGICKRCGQKDPTIPNAQETTPGTAADTTPVATSGTDNPGTIMPTTDPVEPEVPEKNSLWWLWLLIAVVVIVGAIAGIAVHNSKKKN